MREPASRATGASAGQRPFSVSELLAGLRSLLEDRVGRLWVVGEVTNLRAAASGHVYFTLKDAGAQVRAALFRGVARRLAFQPEDGLEVLVYAEVILYEARGDLQLRVLHLEPRGVGALQVAFEQLRARLEREGLFDPERKRPLPELPRRIGVVTSGSGAALRDVLQVSGRRSPATPVLVAPTRVQGEGAEEEIARALDALARESGYDDLDVILLVRGGGSLEDLQAFNTERVARAIRACPVPVVCGVGHEVDVTIADLAADVRAPTPSAAAAQALPDRAELAARLERDVRRLLGAVRSQLQRALGRHARVGAALRAHAPRARLAAQGARLAEARRALDRAGAALLERRRARLGAAVGRIDALSPLAVLGRGYAIVRRADSGAVVRRAAEVEADTALHIRLGEGELDARVTARRSRPGDENA